MNFMVLLRSFEEFIFEAVSWLIFYPLVIWRIITRPLTTMAYSDAEQAQPDSERYNEALSPPLLLFVTVFAVSGLAALLHQEAPSDSVIIQALYSSVQYVALFRAIVFSATPLVAAAIYLHRTRQPVSRDTLRPPFYAQCYLATPVCIFLSLGNSIFHRNDVPDVIGVLLMAGGLIWFAITQVRWFRSRLGVTWIDATITTIAAVFLAFSYIFLLMTPIALV
ncbi:MAG: hypothetical protein U1C74_20150 [Phenylobacterium sp.]|nr:hypothetical protein [Phenylobacterium sp.]